MSRIIYHHTQIVLIRGIVNDQNMLKTELIIKMNCV